MQQAEDLNLNRTKHVDLGCQVLAARHDADARNDNRCPPIKPVNMTRNTAGCHALCLRARPNTTAHFPRWAGRWSPPSTIGSTSEPSGSEQGYRAALWGHIHRKKRFEFASSRLLAWRYLSDAPPRPFGLAPLAFPVRLSAMGSAKRNMTIPRLLLRDSPVIWLLAGETGDGVRTRLVFGLAVQP